MKPLIRKELISIFCSGIGLIFALVFLIASGLMLWFFEGGFNILDAGYATLEKFFTLASILLIILIPALTMRLIAEEKKTRTFDLLRSRPLSISSIWLSKWIGTFIFVVLVIASTFVYVYTLHVLGNPIGNLDLGVILVSYLSLILLSGVFIAIGILASSATSNQIVAFVLALLFNFVVFYGFDLLSRLSSSGSVQTLIASCGLLHHFEQMQRGVIELGDLVVLFVYLILAWIGSVFLLSLNNKALKKEIIGAVVSLLVLLTVSIVFSNLRFDLTKDKRYTLSEYSINLMKTIGEDDQNRIKINVYLEGNLNSGFQRLRNSVSDLLSDLNGYSGSRMDISYIDPASLPIERKQVPEYMSKLGMQGILLNEVDRNGKMSQQLIYPYAQIISDTDTLQVSLLKNTPGNTAEENLNASSEDLEFQFVDALRLLSKNEEVNIAFIEGHGELPRAYVYDAEEALAKYYYVNRGEIGNDVSVLDNFKVIIIAGAKESFTETEKYILDQYLMKGGSIFWLLDGVFVSLDDLYNNGFSASIKNNTNLDDLLFTYGVRIQPVLLQDAQSSSIVVSTGNDTQPVAIPWYYAPLLLPSPDNGITKYISNVKAEFVSSINLLPKTDARADVLLTTSDYTHVVPVPETINFDIQQIQSTPNYFNEAYLSVAASLEGAFRSAFENRSIPDSIVPNNYKTITQSKKARMIVAASSDIIRNDIVGQGDDTQILPMGFDHVSGRQYGNKDFIVNAVNWLADTDNRMVLRSKTQELTLLNKQLIYENRNFYATINTLMPILIMCLLIGVVYFWRKRKYER